MGNSLTKPENVAHERSNFDVINTKKKDSHKVLLLGAGESGKSTFLKQLKIICENGYSLEERLSFKIVVHSNTIQNLIAVLRAMGRFNICFKDSNRVKDAEKFLELVGDREVMELDVEMSQIMKRLWMEENLQHFRRSKDFQVNDSAEYFLDSLDRISHHLYVPTVHDVLKTRILTTGIVEMNCKLGDFDLNIVDVSDQASKERKCIQCYEGVSTIIFFMALSDFDLTLLEDHQEVNRMVVSMEFFDQICNNEWFSNSSIILFLNKKDLFANKLKRRKLGSYFPEYSGDNSYEDASAFMRKRFESLNRKHTKGLYTHFTCATDTNNMQFALLSLTDIIIKNNLNDYGVL